MTPKIARLRFEEAAQDLINDYKANGRKTLKDTQRRVEHHLAKFFAGLRMSRVTTSDIRAYIAQRQEETTVVSFAFEVKLKNGSIPSVSEHRRTVERVSNGEINRELTALKRLFRLAHQAGKLIALPHIPMLKKNNVRSGFFEREQFEAVRRQLPDYARPILTFLYYTGLAHQRGATGPVAAHRSLHRHRAPRSGHHEER